jgi:hypothetical protein
LFKYENQTLTSGALQYQKAVVPVDLLSNIAVFGNDTKRYGTRHENRLYAGTNLTLFVGEGLMNYANYQPPYKFQVLFLQIYFRP